MGWRIKSWKRELGRGEISSDDAPDMTFDAAVALVDDFVVGEDVEIEVARMDDGHRVSKIWPDEPRFTKEFKAAPTIDLEVDLAATAAAALAAFDYLDYTWAGRGADIIVRGSDSAYGSQELTFEAVEYVELPRSWAGKSHRLADRVERQYLATRCEIGSRSIAIRFVDDQRNIFFLVCAAISS